MTKLELEELANKQKEQMYQRIEAIFEAQSKEIKDHVNKIRSALGMRLIP